MTSLGSISLTSSEMQEEIYHKEANLTPLPLFLQDSSATDVFDGGGATATITLRFIKTDTPANLTTFATSFRALINGAQINSNGYPITYVSDIHGTLKVKVSDADATYVAGEPRKLMCTVKLIESSTNG